MTLSSLIVSFIRRDLRDPFRVLLGLVRKLAADPALAIVKADRSLPAPWRRWVHRRARRFDGRSGPLRSILSVLSVAAAGDPEGIARHLHERERRAGERERAWVGRLLVHLEQPELALDWLHGHDDAKALAARGAALARAGHWQAALTAYEEAAANGASRVAVAELAKARSTVEGLSPSWQPAPPQIVTQSPLPMRVLHLINNSLPHTQTGYTVRTQRVARAQQDFELEPIMVTRPGFPWNQGHFAARVLEVIDGVQYHHIPDYAAGQRGVTDAVTHAIRSLIPIIRDVRPAALQPTSPHVNAQTALALGRTFHIPVVYEVRGFLEETWLSRRPPEAINSDHYVWSRNLEAACAAQADRVVTLGNAMRDDLVARGVAPERVTVIPNAVDVDVFRPHGIGDRVRDRLGLGSAIVLGYVGSLVPYEGLETLLGAIRELHDCGSTDARCLIVGDGAARSELEATAQSLGIAGAVQFVGRVPPDQVFEYYEAIDLFVVPRRDERVCRLVTPLKPVEAMAMERCVVVSALPALEELVQPGATGLTFTAGDATALAEVVEPLLHDQDGRKEMGRAARQQVQEERTWQKVGLQYRTMFDELGVGRRRGT